ncbi:MAG: hypothetical protein ABI599_04265 [Flavobacteriales bacterium]
MFNNAYFDTIICIVLVFALLSIVVSFVVEWWIEKIKARGSFLQMIIRRILRDDLNHDYGYRLYQHPTINRMRRGIHSYPSYISAEAFSNALIETIAEDGGDERYVLSEDGKTGTRVNEMKDKPLGIRFVAGVKVMKESPMRRLFLNFIDRNGGTQEGELDIHSLKAEIGRWFDDHMDRASGEYKIKLKPKLLGIGLLVAFALNVDTIHLIKVFMLDEPLRNRTVAAAEGVADKYASTEGQPEEVRIQAVIDTLVTMPSDTTVRVRMQDTIVLKVVARMGNDSALARKKQDARDVLDRINRLQLPLGWDQVDVPISWFKDTPALASKADDPAAASLLAYFDDRNTLTAKNFFLWFFGVIITGFALGQGAPFWFALLVKLVNIRRAGAKPKSTQGSNSD